jgi:hypothetical protein
MLIRLRRIGVRKRVELLHNLCEWRLCDAEERPPGEQVDVAPDHMRVTPLGADQAGNNYWHFSGNRLYREGRPESIVFVLVPVCCSRGDDAHTGYSLIRVTGPARKRKADAPPTYVVSLYAFTLFAF